MSSLDLFFLELALPLTLGCLGGLSVHIGSPDPLGAVYTVDSVNVLQTRMNKILSELLGGIIA